MTSAQVRAPGGFVPEVALAFGDVAEGATAVTPGTPLPVQLVTAPSPTAALTGVSTGAGLVGPFAPQLGTPIRVRLEGLATGVAQLLRSPDATATRARPITVAGATFHSWTADCQEVTEIETEAGASYWLSLPAAGITYRVSQ